MSDEKPKESRNVSAEDLTKKPAEGQLNEQELKDVSGGGTHFKVATIQMSKAGTSGPGPTVPK